MKPMPARRARFSNLSSPTLALAMLRSFVPAFLGAMFLFAFVIELLDLFANITRYMRNDVGVLSILRSVALFAPKCVSYSLPISALFAASYVFGTMYANNELIVVYGSGISVYEAAVPVVALAVAMSVGGFYLDDRLVVPAQAARAALLRQLTGQKVSLSNAELTLIGKGKRTIWHADFYDDDNTSLSGPSVIVLDDAGRFKARIEAVRAVWAEGAWAFQSARVFAYDAESGRMGYEYRETYSDPGLDESPETFRARKADVGELDAAAAKEYVDSLRDSGLPYAEPLAEYHKRFSFSLTPLIVVLLSVGTAGRFRKNALLASLLLSLLAATGFYVLQMVTMLFAKNGVLPPALGPYLPVLFFTGIGVVLIATTRT